MTARREGAAILFVNPRGEVLLRLRSDRPGLLFANQWDTIGGAVELGESHEEAAVRETREEIGLELQGHIYWDEYQSLVLVRIYAAPLDVPSEEIELTEGQRVEWFDLEAAMKLPLHPWVAAILPEFMQSDAFSQAKVAAATGSGVKKP
jgi:8-oxo-dGTP diphosphatase